MKEFQDLLRISVEHFLVVHYERAPYFANARSGVTSQIYSVGELEAQLWRSGDRLASQLAVHREGVRLSPTPHEDTRAWALRMYRQGATLILHDVGRDSVSVARIQRMFEVSFGAMVRTNAYLTPPSAQGNHVHFDSHDVFVVQIEGRKVWSSYPPHACTLPLPGQRIALDCEALGPVTSHELTPGAVLYLPRGYPHQARSGDASSLHLTFGLHPPLWRDLAEAALELAAERDPTLRRASLPSGLDASDRAALRASVLAAMDLLDAAASRLEQRRVAGLSRLPENDLTPVRALTPDSAVEHPVHMVMHVSRHEGAVGLTFPGLGVLGARGAQVLDLPGEWEPVLRFIATARGSFTAADLPGTQPEAARIAVLATLVERGALRLT